MASAASKPLDVRRSTTAADVQSTTLTKGDGETLSDGDLVSAQLWIGNGFSQKQAYSSYDQGGAQQLTLNDQLSPVLLEALQRFAKNAELVEPLHVRST